MKKLRNTVLSLTLILTSHSLWAQEKLVVDATHSVSAIAPTMYGIFFEDINFAADGGIYAELVKNRSFEFTLPKMGWSEPNFNKYGLNKTSGESNIVRYKEHSANSRYLHIIQYVSQKYQLVNEGFRGMGIKAGAAYDFSIKAANAAGISEVLVELIDGEEVIGVGTIAIKEGDWKNYQVVLNAAKTVEKAKLRLSFIGEGTIDIDFISLFPQDTWKGRKAGLRKDMVELLDDLDPGFLRFPGGCIVEGRTLDRRYQWKNTVGAIEERQSLVNRWNTEYNVRLTPDYYQSFGLGFYEYFLLSEDLGAEPLPILGCGMACQFNTAELVPLDELEPYIQDALDLIEFANGSTDTYWGKLRADMGHPEPFNMKYIGIGNEQWGPNYFERYIEFEKVLRAQYPEIQIISTAGPFPDGEFFEYGWNELKKLDPDLVDEHYYRSPKWFLDNADRYDSYDRKGPKVFAGEYAAHTEMDVEAPNRNNWESALSEAAFMTGLERNADIVTMSAYAPLFAHLDAWQWKTDLIWFNNLNVYGTPSYYVQKLYANNPGTDLLTISLDGEQPTGQQGIYASAVKDENKNELIVKIANTSKQDQELMLQVLGAQLKNTMQRIELRADDLAAVNSIGQPKKIYPKELKQKLNTEKQSIAIASESFNVLKFKLK